MNNTINISNVGLRDESGALKPSRVFALFAYITAAAIYLPTVLFTELIDPASYIYMLLSLGMPILGIWLCSKLAGSFRAVLVFVFVVGAMLFMGIPTVVSVFFLLIALTAYALYNRLYILPVPAAIGAFLIPFFLTSSIVISALSLVFILAATALFLCFKKDKNRTSTVCTVSFWLLVPVLALLAVKFFVIDGGQIEELKEAVVVFRDEITVSLFNELMTVLMQTYEISGADLGVGLPTENIASLISYTIMLVFRYLPAMIVVVSFITCYVIHSLFVTLVSPITEDKGKIIRAITFNMSVTSAVLFLICLVASLVLEKEGLDLYATVAQNLYVILFPGLMLITVSFVTSLAKGPQASCVGAITYLFFFAMLIFRTAPTLVISSFAGAAIVIVAAAKRKADEWYLKNKRD